MGLAGRPFWSYWCYFSQCRVAGDPEAGGVPLPRRWENADEAQCSCFSLVIRIGIRRSRMGMAVVVVIIGKNNKEDNAIDIERSGYDQDGNDSRTD